MRRKHIPQRTCVVCRRKMDKRRLLRIVRTVENGTVADLTGKQNGRGAYLCDDLVCWDKALNSKVLDRELQVEITETERKLLFTFRPQVNINQDVP